MPNPPPSRPPVDASRRRAVVALSTLVGGTVATLLPLASTEAATPSILLGTSSSFAVLAGSGITNTGDTTIAGDVGTFPTPSETGFGSITLDGVDHVDDAVTQQAKIDLTTAYDQAAASGPTTAVGTELGGLTLAPGVYGSDTLGITGTLTLDTLGDPQAVFVFQADTTLTTATDSAVVVLGGGQACNVFWQIGTSATLGTRAHLVGSVLAASSITATTGATVQGRLLASTGAVTLDHNTLTRAVCTAGTTSTTVAEQSTTLATTGSTTGATTIGSTAVDTTDPTDATPSGATPPTATGAGTPTTASAGDLPPTPDLGTPTTAVPSTTPTGPTAPRLPYTGSETRGLVVVGLAFFGFGASAAWASRRCLVPLDA